MCTQHSTLYLPNLGCAILYCVPLIFFPLSSWANPDSSWIKAQNPSCGNDHFEPNDARSKARNISTELLGERQIEANSCRGDEDWYTIWLTQGQLIELRLEGTAVDRWPGISLYAPRKRKPQGIRHRGKGVQTLKVYAKHSGRYRLKVRGRGDEASRYLIQMRRLTR